jgi:polyisoprenoid-binding protein YceI
MVTFIVLFSLFAGIITTIAFAKNIGGSVKAISHYILGLVTLLLSLDYFSVDNSEGIAGLPLFLIAILSFLFFVGEVTKNKFSLGWNIIPMLLTGFLFLIPDLSATSFLESGTDGFEGIIAVALLSAITPFLTHLAKLGISNLIIRFGSIRWADNEDNYLESLVSYAFIGGISALGLFLSGYAGLLVAATFYTGASLVARNKLGLKNDIILSAGSALYLIAAMLMLLEYGGYSDLDFTRGEILEGAFVGGFMILIYDLLLLLARFNNGKWKFLLIGKAILVPILAIGALAFAYTQLERLGGVLSLAAVLISLALISVLFSLFKDYTYIGLKLITVGSVFLITPYIMPIQQTSSIDLAELGIAPTENNVKEESTQVSEPEGKSFDEALGKWKINEENSKIFFELGPEKGRTKGEFQVVKGDFTVAEDLEKSKLKVVLPVKSLTTFIGPRDEHLMEKDYFHEEKYPEITFKATQFTQENDALIVTGDFTMMGVTKSLDVKLKLIGKGEKDGNEVLVLWGKSQLNRTDFGMASSSKIGDLVEFTYEVQLEK